MSRLDADVLIVGAGCAGLSLAWHLAEQRFDGRVVLVDRRTSYERDRTFCFWNAEPNPFAHLASHRWPRWRVRDAEKGAWIEQRAPGLAYHHVPADTFYRHVRARIEPDMELRLGVRVGEVEQDRVRVDGADLRARIVFDSRPRSSPNDAREIVLLQHFEGWHVRTEPAVFDPEVATLMDFGVSQEHGLHFMYVLPYSEIEALVESTFFSPRVVCDEVYHASIERYLREELGAEHFEILHRERGVIPMSTEAMSIREGERLYRIGLAGGMAKPSTGYAFAAIQRFSAEMARRMKREELPDPPEPRPWRAKALDRIFLSHLARNKERGPAMLTALFARVDPVVLVRFLSDVATPSETVAVMRAMPFLPLTAETLRSPRVWLRR